MNHFGLPAPRIFGNWVSKLLILREQGFEVQPILLSNGKVYLSGKVGQPHRFNRRLLSRMLIPAALIIAMPLIAASQFAPHAKGTSVRSVATHNPIATAKPVPSTKAHNCLPNVGQAISDYLNSAKGIAVLTDVNLGALRGLSVRTTCDSLSQRFTLQLRFTADQWVIEKVTRSIERVTF